MQVCTAYEKWNCSGNLGLYTLLCTYLVSQRGRDILLDDTIRPPVQFHDNTWHICHYTTQWYCLDIKVYANEWPGELLEQNIGKQFWMTRPIIKSYNFFRIRDWVPDYFTCFLLRVLQATRKSIWVVVIRAHNKRFRGILVNTSMYVFISSKPLWSA
jgi:hypothetical protein